MPRIIGMTYRAAETSFQATPEFPLKKQGGLRPLQAVACPISGKLKVTRRQFFTPERGDKKEEKEMFVNFSNHALDQWNEEQKAAALELGGEIFTVPFPNVPATATAEEVDRLAERSVAEILLHEPEFAMVQGEFTLAFAVTRKLLAAGVRCVAACSERDKKVIVNPDGTTTATAVFKFVQFREFTI